jgi:type II secretory pathway pseudopilin PulG
MTMKPLQIVIVIALFAVGLLYWYSEQQQAHYDVATQRYIQQALNDITTWQRENIKKHLTPAALATIDDKQIDALIERYRTLGALKRVDDLQFARVMAALSFFNPNILLSYHGKAIYENGSTSLAITVIANNGELKIYNFSFGTPQLK